MAEHRAKHKNRTKHWYDFGFDHAAYGVWAAIKSEKSIKVAVLYSVAVAIMGVVLSITAVEAMMLVLALGLIFVAEYLNTALEYAVDLSTEDILEEELGKSPLTRNAQLAKDIAAASALIATIIVGVISLIIFVPKLLALI